ncbi:MAG: UDP-N-acetyl glucosamine 2-epimerase, partial [Chloroflexi bacterium]|nr:UDP-N-acetyl glucosamine 2-epimerase [Chloroflexota bacterium]
SADAGTARGGRLRDGGATANGLADPSPHARDAGAIRFLAAACALRGPEPDGVRGPARSRAARRLTLVEPLGYLEFLGLMAGARVVLTDSGGVQEETTALGVPCLTLRESTERPVTVSEGTNRVVGTVPEQILSALDGVLERGSGRDGVEAPSSQGRTPPLAGRRVPVNRLPEGWDGHAAERIVAILRRALGASAAQNRTLDRAPGAVGIGGISSP